MSDILAECRGTYLLLNQDKVWIDANGKHHQIEAMSVRYKANVSAFLERRAVRLADLYGYGEITVTMSDPLAPRGEMAQDALGHELEQADKARMADPVGWLRETKLVRRLIADVASDQGGEDD